ncbi:MAG: helix-turn-helix transcriptional regulator [Bdellovibrionaceae bacterium]|nr:helix-turn-helix transcriptional regulator [Pseudobdellovibrionaceae bacterium]
MNAIGKTLKAECQKRGITLTQLAKMAGVPKATLHAWTSGREPSLKQLKKVADALGLSFYKLAFGIHDPNEIQGEVLLKEIFSGDVRVTLHKIERRKND